MVPPLCLACDAPVLQVGQFCPSCFSRVHLIAAPVCERCGVPFAAAAQGGAFGVCDACRRDPPPWRRARAALAYDAVARRLVLPLKYADRPETARHLAPLMARAGAALLAGAEVIVPVPLHRRRLFERRYNQAAVLARALAGPRVPALVDALVRTRATAPLAELGHAARTQEVAGAFAVRPSRVGALRGRAVLLVDDVLTSGATAAGCARTLLQAGAASVDVLALARALRHP
ncbi:MAG: ComF family protein [Rhodospirillales bacterium]|nr:ComF family protein [Rhodospirillales bacterium]